MTFTAGISCDLRQRGITVIFIVEKNGDVPITMENLVEHRAQQLGLR